MLNHTKLPARELSDWTFTGADAYYVSCDSNVFLLSKKNTSIILSPQLFRELNTFCLSSNLSSKLQSRGFGESPFHNYQKDPIRPTFFMIDFTTQCNMNCYYCLRHFKNVGEVITEKQLRSILEYIVDYCRENSLTHITIQPWGGEPLIALDRIIFMKQFLQDQGIFVKITVQTNGLLLTEENVRTMRLHDIGIGISIDGIETVHNIHRKNLADENTFDKVIAGIRRVQEYYGNDIGTITVNSKFSLTYIEDSIEYMVKELKLSTLKFNLMHPNGDDFDCSTVISDKEIPIYLKKIINSLIKLNSEGFHVNEINIRDKIINLLSRNSGDLCHTYGCTGGYTFVSFARNGDIFPCELVGNETVKLGSVHNKESLPKLIINNIARNRFFSCKTSEKCVSCEWHGFCHGGCTASALSFTNKVSIDKKECIINRYLYPELIELVLTQPSIVKLMTKNKVEIV